MATTLLCLLPSSSFSPFGACLLFSLAQDAKERLPVTEESTDLDSLIDSG